MAKNDQILQAALGACFLGMLSAVLVKSDTYRYAAIIAIGLAAASSAKLGGAKMHSFVMKDGLAIACLASGGAALARFLLDYAVTGQKSASEWLYAFPLFFPFIGIALAIGWHTARPVFCGLFIYGFIVVVGMVRVYRASLAGVLRKSAAACYLTCTLYFALTLLSNSNNRLAIGESYALLFSALFIAVAIKQRRAAAGGLAVVGDGQEP